MTFRDDGRAQAVQVGAVLLLGILVLSLTLYQALVVPQQNEGVEFESYLDATNDLVSLQQDVLFSGTQDNVRGQTVRTGTQYPSRVVAINPPAPNGRLNATQPRNATLTGVKAVNGESENVRDFLNASEKNYSTRAIRFSPGYHEFDAPPIVVTGASAYRASGDVLVPLTGQTLVSGNRITLVTVAGDVNVAGQSVPVTVEPVSAATRSVTVTGTGEEFNLTMPTPGSPTAWNDSAVAQQLRDNPNVVGTYVNGSNVDVVFNGTRAYELRLARVVVREKEDRTDITEPEGRYLVPVSDESVVTADSRKTLTVEVRDRYNNPVAGEAVNFTATNGDLWPAGNLTTDGEGRASVRFTPDGLGPATVNATMVGGTETYQNTTFEFNVVSSTGGGGDGGGTGDINPANASTQDVILQTAVQGQGNDKNQAILTFNNTASSTRHIETARISFYYADQDQKPATSATLGSSSTSVPVGGNFKTLSPTVSIPTGEHDVTMTFSPGGVETVGDFFILTVYYEENPNQQVTYFVSVQT